MFSPFLVNIVLKVLPDALKIKGKNIGKEDVKLSLYSGNIIIYILRNLKTGIIYIYKSELRKVTRHNVTFKNQLYAFLLTANVRKIKSTKPSSFTVASKMITYFIINLTKDMQISGDTGLIPVLGRSPRGGNCNLLQSSCLGNPMDRGGWWATVHGVAKELDTT